jgi:type II secretory pathway pseudopilin PulG
MPLQRERGSALVVTLILITILSIVALALVKRSTNEIESVSAKRHYDATASCAEAARNLVISKFASAGANLTQLNLQITIGDKTFFTGHYSTTLPDGGLSNYVADGGITAMQAAAGGGSSGGATDSANKVFKLSLGTTPYRVVVVCQDANNVSRQTEVEFTVNYGL